MALTMLRRAVAAAAVVWIAGVPPAWLADDAAEPLRFAAEMARRGDWREARYRWDRATRSEPDNPRILNNLAVALEVLGDTEGAARLYARASSLAPGDPIVADNAERAARFRRETGTGGDAASQTSPPGAPAPGGKERRRGDRGTYRIPVKLPLPPRLDLSRARTVLVASFQSNDTEILDAGREIVRFLRGEMKKRTRLEVLDVVPPPAVPEQALPDLVANSEFWRHLGREHGADVILSGAIRFSRRDASGFEDVDSVSTLTGQKIRQTQFVEQERFTFELDVFYFDGATGGLLLRDRLQRSSVFRGRANDPITAFYQLGDTISGEVLSAVSPRTKEDVRVIFRG